jgi:hypothetical protein
MTLEQIRTDENDPNASANEQIRRDVYLFVTVAIAKITSRLSPAIARKYR